MSRKISPTFSVVPALVALTYLCLAGGCRVEEKTASEEAQPVAMLTAAGAKVQTTSIASNDFSICAIALDFTDVPVTDAQVAPAGKLPYLETLVLRGTKITDAGLAVFKDSQRLETVDLSHTSVSGSGLHDLHDNFIKDLNLADTKFDDESVANLVEIGLHLVRLNLAAAKIGDEDLEPFKKLRGLEALDLSRTAITGAGLHYLPGGLKQLNLSGTAISDASLAHLEPFKLLERLDLSGTKISDAAIPHVEAMIESQDKSFTRRKFRYLNLRKTAVSDKAIAALKSTAPELTVER